MIWLVDFGGFGGAAAEARGAAGEDEGSGSDADDVVGLAVEQNLAADDGGVGLKAAAPEGLGNDDYFFVALLFFVGGEIAAYAGFDAECVEPTRRDERSVDLFRITAAGEVERVLAGHGDALDGGELLLPDLEDGDVGGEGGVALGELGDDLPDGPAGF